MRWDGYKDSAINQVVLALVTSDEEEMRPAFELFADDGELAAKALYPVVPLLGEILEPAGP